MRIEKSNFSEEMPILSRVFLVSCGRSGSTLLQSLLTAHPRIASFPESQMLVAVLGYIPERLWGFQSPGAFATLRSLRSKWRIRLGIAAQTGREHVRNFLKSIDQEDLMALFPNRGSALAPQLDACIAIWDQMAQQQNRPIWLEKSALHLAYLPEIEMLAPEARFIHIVRNGPDVIASLWDVSHRYPESWPYCRSLPERVAQWNHCLAITRRDAHKPNHLVVRYEQLVEETAGVVQAVCRFLEIDYHEEMLHSYTSAFSKIARPEEPWKAGVQGEIKNTNGSKFSSLFDAEQQRYIREHLTPLQDNEFYLSLPSMEDDLIERNVAIVRQRQNRTEQHRSL